MSALDKAPPSTRTTSTWRGRNGGPPIRGENRTKSCMLSRSSMLSSATWFRDVEEWKRRFCCLRVSNVHEAWITFPLTKEASVPSPTVDCTADCINSRGITTERLCSIISS